jgi:chemotaxis family two-component system response regulator Rcp1
MPPSAAPIVALVDDNPGDIGLVTMAFDTQGLEAQLRVIGSGPAAFYYFRALVDQPGGELPHLLLLDLNMPGLNGFQLLAYLRTQPALAPMKILIFSSTHRHRDHDRALELGASGILVKPADWSSYPALVEQIRPHLAVVPGSETGGRPVGVPS